MESCTGSLRTHAEHSCRWVEALLTCQGVQVSQVVVLCCQLHCTNMMVFTYMVQHKPVAGCLHHASLVSAQPFHALFYLLQPALYEAFGLTVVEAMTCGLPTFATCNGGPSEIIKNGKSGFHIDPYHGEKVGNPSCLSSHIAQPVSPSGRCHGSWVLVHVS